MNPNSALLYIFVGAILGLVVTAIFFWRRKPSASMEHELKDLLHRMEDFKDRLSDRFSQELHAMRQELSINLSSQRASSERQSQAVHKQLMEFTAGVTEMSQKLQRVEGSIRNHVEIPVDHPLTGEAQAVQPRAEPERRRRGRRPRRLPKA